MTAKPPAMSSNALRTAFLDYFASKQHHIMSAGSLLNKDDPSLMFTIAGMGPFKKAFLGEVDPPYPRVTSAQPCVRVGGKHNDLDEVGISPEHHTLFEMQGNFSFGDYFKREAIKFAWEFLTEVLALPPERLWITVHEHDQESERIWLNEIGVSAQRFSRCGDKDNFWQMGDTGPCGPCTEIFYDHEPEGDGDPPGSAQQEGDRYTEIWNLVFMQYDRDAQGRLNKLPKPCVDTGMGLERIAAVMQGVRDNYDIDTFQQLLKALSALTDITDFKHKSMRVIVDHIRSSSFLMADGVTPSNEGPGYVLRRIIRRALRHGHKLGLRQPFFYRLVKPLIDVMGNAYPHLVSAQAVIEQLTLREEQQFLKTLSHGLKLLNQVLAQLSSDTIAASVVFQLYDTYGFPVDLTADIAREHRLKIDRVGFNELMDKQRHRSQRHQQFDQDYTQRLHIAGKTDFVGYTNLAQTTTVIALLQGNQPIQQLHATGKATVVLQETPFYAEAGGQVGDKGRLLVAGGQGEFIVQDTQKQGDVYLHKGELKQGQLTVQDQVEAIVDGQHREAVSLNHTATHLLHAALRQVLGDHVQQKGSLVQANRLRFDFTHMQPLTLAQRQAIEKLVNQHIRSDVAGVVNEMSLEDAKKQGALALFGERYAHQVRVLRLGDFSMEICGGTHVSHTSEIGLFKLTHESAVAAGIRRLEAVTGLGADDYVIQQEQRLLRLSAVLNSTPAEVETKLNTVIKRQTQLQDHLEQAQQKIAKLLADKLLDQIVSIGPINLLVTQLDALDKSILLKIVDQLKQRKAGLAVVLATLQHQRVQLVAAVSKDCLAYFNAQELLQQIAAQVGGKGGGRPELAQGGGSQIENLPAALENITAWVSQQVK